MADDREPGAGSAPGGRPPVISQVPTGLGRQRSTAPLASPPTVDDVEDDDVSDTIPRIRPSGDRSQVPGDAAEPPAGQGQSPPPIVSLPPKAVLPEGAVIPPDSGVPAPTAVPSSAATPAPTAVQPPGAGGGRRRRTLATVAAVLVLAAAGGVGWWVSRPQRHPAVATHASGPATGGGVAANSSARAAANRTGSSTPTSVSVPPATPAPGQPGYDTYTDPRFEFTVIYPAGFVASPQKPSGDGMEWVGGEHGAVTVRAFGTNNTNGRTATDEEVANTQGAQVRYSRVKGDGLTLSKFADDGKTIVYMREVVGRGSIDTLEWTYPAAQQDEWAPIIAITARNFVTGALAQPH